MPSLDVRGCGRSWAIYDGDKRISGFFGNFQLAADSAAVKEKKRRLRDRACLCCCATFKSEGSHNRLCDRCRRMS